jgi:hypothetical protein
LRGLDRYRDADHHGNADTVTASYLDPNANPRQYTDAQPNSDVHGHRNVDGRLGGGVPEYTGSGLPAVD